jgi:hypothetical protein
MTELLRAAEFTAGFATANVTPPTGWLSLAKTASGSKTLGF